MSEQLFAAVDLGSNSFHLIIVQEDNGRLVVVDKIREMVQLAFGLQEDNSLEDEVKIRALDCLTRFGERLVSVPKSHIRAVGTNAFRRLKNPAQFLYEAEQRLGTTIDIIAGREEARLIYLGVSQHIEHHTKELLVMDIGGGSTEFIVGEGTSLKFVESLEIGCVTFSKRFFNDNITTDNIKRARLAVASELQPYIIALTDNRHRYITGASGSIKTIAAMLHHEGWCLEGIHLEGLDKLLAILLELKTHKAISKYFDLTPERARVITAGVVILLQVFESFKFKRMNVADTAMREGIILDLLGRLHKEDMRDRTIKSLLIRFGVDELQASRVTETSLLLSYAVKAEWALTTADLRYLNWAAYLHEIGLFVEHSNYHRHGEYFIQHADLDGLSERDKRIIATIIRNHRRKIHQDFYEYLPASALYITLILRLSVIFHRTRQDLNLGLDRIEAQNKSLRLHFTMPETDSPYLLLEEDLTNERKYWRQIGFELSWQATNQSAFASKHH